MKILLAVVAMIAMIGFNSFTHGADATTKAAKPKKGRVVKVEAMELTYNGGVKGKGKEYTIKTDDKTKVTLEGKEAKLADLKPEMYIEVTAEKGMATLIAASAEAPKEKDAAKPDAGKTSDPKTPDSKTPAK